MLLLKPDNVSPTNASQAVCCIVNSTVEKFLAPDRDRVEF